MGSDLVHEAFDSPSWANLRHSKQTLYPCDLGAPPPPLWTPQPILVSTWLDLANWAVRLPETFLSLENHLEERLDQAQARASYTPPFFWGLFAYGF